MANSQNKDIFYEEEVPESNDWEEAQNSDRFGFDYPPRFASASLSSLPSVQSEQSCNISELMIFRNKKQTKERKKKGKKTQKVKLQADEEIEDANQEWNKWAQLLKDYQPPLKKVIFLQRKKRTKKLQEYEYLQHEESEKEEYNQQSENIQTGRGYQYRVSQLLKNKKRKTNRQLGYQQLKKLERMFKQSRYTVQQLCQYFKISKNSVYRLMKEYQQNNGQLANSYLQRQKMRNEEKNMLMKVKSSKLLQAIKEIIESNIGIQKLHKQDIQYILHNSYGIEVSQSIISRCLNKLKSFIITVLQQNKINNQPQIISKQQHYNHQIKHISQESSQQYSQKQKQTLLRHNYKQGQYQKQNYRKQQLQQYFNIFHQKQEPLDKYFNKQQQQQEIYKIKQKQRELQQQQKQKKEKQQEPQQEIIVAPKAQGLKQMRLQGISKYCIKVKDNQQSQENKKKSQSYFIMRKVIGGCQIQKREGIQIAQQREHRYALSQQQVKRSLHNLVMIERKRTYFKDDGSQIYLFHVIIDPMSNTQPSATQNFYPQQNHSSCTLLLALNQNSLLSHQIIKSKPNQETWLSFLHNSIIKTKKNTKYVFLNQQFKEYRSLQNQLNDRKIQCFLLPKDSPLRFLQNINLIISRFRHLTLKRNPIAQNLAEIMEDVFQSIKPKLTPILTWPF